MEEKSRSGDRRLAGRLSVGTALLLAGVLWGDGVWLRAAEPAAEKSAPPRRTLADLMHVSDAFTTEDAAALKLNIDEAKIQAAGIRKLAGKHLTLYTDLAADAEIDALPEVFDQAFLQWCDYFGKRPDQSADWHITGVLMKDGMRFALNGLLPDRCRRLSRLLHGRQALALRTAQRILSPALLLHEGTHAFMLTVLGSCGPPWYMEGLAELLGTHRWHDGRLTAQLHAANRDEVLRWGRIKLVEDDYAARRAKRLQTIVERQQIGTAETSMYAWCWAAATLLDRHPRYHQRFRQLQHLSACPIS